MMVKTRTEQKSNYRAIFVNGKTLRFKIDSSKPILELKHPEFYDVKITNKCYGGCSYCYQNSSRTDKNYDIIENIKSFFGSLTENERPFQVAIGGGEPTIHPDFIKCLKTFYDLGIMPNYTTNGTSISQEILDATKKYCGGVAVSMHPHLNQKLYSFIKHDIKLNLHIMISDKKSIDYFLDVYKKYKGSIEYFVLLPIINQGRATDYKIESKYLFKKLNELDGIKDISFGAMFHPYLKENKFMGLSLYDPEMFSKYLDMKDMSLYKSSFNNTKIIIKENKMSKYVGTLKKREEVLGTDHNRRISDGTFTGRYMHRLKAYEGKTILLEADGDHFKFGDYRLHKDWISNATEITEALPEAPVVTTQD